MRRCEGMTGQRRAQTRRDPRSRVSVDVVPAEADPSRLEKTDRQTRGASEVSHRSELVRLDRSRGVRPPSETVKQLGSRRNSHFVHFRSMCWTHIPLQRRSSSASVFQSLETWTAIPSEKASRYESTLSDTSRGNSANGSSRIRLCTWADRRESCMG